MPLSGISLFSGKEFAIESIEVLYYWDTVYGTYIPCEDNLGNVWYKFIINESCNAAGSEVSNKLYSINHVKAHIAYSHEIMRITLGYDQVDKKVIVRWNRNKSRWSRFQRDWQDNVKRLFMFDNRILDQLLINDYPWTCPGPRQTGYFRAVDESRVQNTNGNQDVAAITGHKITDGVIKYRVRWEDYIYDDETT